MKFLMVLTITTFTSAFAGEFSCPENLTLEQKINMFMEADKKITILRVQLADAKSPKEINTIGKKIDNIQLTKNKLLDCKVLLEEQEEDADVESFDNSDL